MVEYLEGLRPSPLKERGINPVRIPNGVKGMR